jgi:hypothetical protein
VDTDRNGRITAREVRGAILWTLALLSGAEGLEAGSDSLRLEDIDRQAPQAEGIIEACEKMLSRLGRDASAAISLTEIREIIAAEEARPVSEAGVVLPEAAEDERIGKFLADVVQATGGAEHPSGQKGVSRGVLDGFLAAAEAWLNWQQRGQLPGNGKATPVMPLEADTPKAFAVFSALSGKLDQFFAQCEALSLDEGFSRRMGLTEAELDSFDFDDPSGIEKVLASAPIARANPERALDMTGRLNPFYGPLIERFRREVLPAVLDEAGDELTAAQWLEVKQFFAVHQQWLAERPNDAVAGIPVETLRGYLSDNYAGPVRELIAASTDRAFVLENLRLVEKLVLCQGHLMDLANNMVSFPHLYDPASRAMLEMGTLVMDARRFNLAVRVGNRAEHVQVAQTSQLCVLYVEVRDPLASGPYEVAVPVTAGSRGNLCVGKRGIFTDVRGRECDARVMHILENPVSVAEALAGPFKRLGRMITGKIESITAEAEKTFEQRSNEAINQAPVGQAAQGQQAAPAAGPGQPSRFAGGGLLVGGGLAVAAVTSAIAYVGKTLANVHYLYILGVLASAIAAVIAPIAVVSLLKLRRRDLSAILEGSGWAINARMRLTRRQKRYFTCKPRYPAGARARWRLLRRLALPALAAALVGVAIWLAWWVFL